MTKDDFKIRIDEAGDAVITYKSQKSRKQKYNICTRDFTTPIFRRRKLEQRKIPAQFYYFVGIQTHTDY